MTATLRVRNIAQKVLMDEELKGQISDGAWENLNVTDHWQVWCDAEVVVDPANVGRDFWAKYDHYNFTNKELLEIVGQRMVESVRIALTFGAENVDLLTGVGFSDYPGEYYDVQRNRVRRFASENGLTLDELKANVEMVKAHEGIYSYDQMLVDLKDLKRIKRERCQ